MTELNIPKSDEHPDDAGSFDQAAFDELELGTDLEEGEAVNTTDDDDEALDALLADVDPEDIEEPEDGADG